MAKITVLQQTDGERSPFLRGVLVQSLVDIGLSFDEACELARIVRNELQYRDLISSAELRQRVSALLEERFGKLARERYDSRPGSSKPGIMVHTQTRSMPFSVGILAHSLETCAISPEKALLGAKKVLSSLRTTGHREVDHKALRRIIYRCLMEHCSRTSAERYLSWRRFENSGTPLMVLIGGVTGTGKSTISSELSYRLDISRHQSTDMMREIIRSYLSPQMVPTLMYPSFEAWRGLPDSGDTVALENRVVTGFLSQFAAMKLAMKAAIERCVEERSHLVLEGVHVVPSQLELDLERTDAIIVPVMLVTMKKRMLGKQLKRRSRENARGKWSNYIDRLDDIWELQSWLLDEADRNDIHIVENWYIEDTVRAVIDYVITVLMKRYPPQVDDVVWEG